MGKVLYILFLLIINSHVWNLRVVNISSDNWLVIQLVYLLAGFIFYGKMNKFRLFSEELAPWWLWVIGVLLSVIPAGYFYNQSITQSLITCRGNLLLLQIPILFKIAPTKKEIINALLLFFGFVWIVYFMQSADISIVNLDEERLERFINTGEKPMVNGFVFIAIILFYYLGEIKDSFGYKWLFFILICYIFYLLEQNRSFLFSISLIIAWTILKVNRKKFIAILTMGVLVSVIAYYTIDMWMELFEETSVQIENDNYNRNKAYRYFLFEASPNIWCYIFGNGFISAHTSNYLHNIMYSGVYNSDVGIIGYWNNFGIIPTIVFFYLLVSAAIGRHSSHFIRCWAIQLLLCSLTAGYLGAPDYILYFSLFYYLYYVDKEEQTNAAELIESKEIART